MTAPSPQLTALGPYRILELIGRGGMGEVYRAFDTRRGRTVALKVLAPEYARDSHYRARFRREADSAARLQDPHVVPIHDFGEIDGRLFIDMRLVDGQGLDEILGQGPIDLRRAVELVAQIAEALTSAHELGIIHRDVKPSNILVTRSGFAYLADFGIARSLHESQTHLTETGRAVGTLAYMAPERFEGGQPDHRSDVYSLACVLVECLTGNTPFDSTSLPALMRAHIVAPPPRPSRLQPGIPAAIDDVVAHGMAKEPGERWQNTHELATAARRALDGVTVPRKAAPGRPGKPGRAQSTPGTGGRGTRMRLLAGVGAVVTVTAAAAGGGYVAGLTASGPAAGPGPTPSATSQRAAGPFGVVPTRGARSSRYTYTVQSNYDVQVAFTDDEGNTVSQVVKQLPWTRTVTPSAWGPDAVPMLTVQSMSPKGDATVSCTLTDAGGNVVKSDEKGAAFASGVCTPY